MDDLLSVDNPYLVEGCTKSFEEGGIYPAALTLKKTNESCLHAEFVGIDLSLASLDDASITPRMLFKERKFPWPVHKYPRVNSLIPQSIPYGVFTGELHRAHIICRPGIQRTDDFTDAAIKVAKRLCQNGCEPRKLRGKFAAFVYTKFTGENLPANTTLWQHQRATIQRFDTRLALHTRV
jgi:hypothetical protein